jgi:ankyrin repeat protein
MGKTLGSILFPQYLIDSDVHSFVSLFDEYNLNINDHFSWLDGNTPLGNALLYSRFELADELVKAGAIINLAILNGAAMINNSEILAWFLENKAELVTIRIAKE